MFYIERPIQIQQPYEYTKTHPNNVYYFCILHYIGVGTAAAGAAMAAALFDIKLLIFMIFTNNTRHDKHRTVPLLLRRDHYRSCYTRIGL